MSNEPTFKSETIPNEPPFHIVCIYGQDWSSERGPIRFDYPFSPYDCWVAGLLLKETDEYICIAQDYCPATGNVRDVMTIPKNNILKRYDFTPPNEIKYINTLEKISND